MIRFIKQNKLLVAGFALVLALTVFFGFGAIQHAREFRGAPTEQSVEGWMTTRYVAHTWHIPREVMTDLGFEKKTDARRPLSKIAEERGIPVDELIAEIEAAIAAHRAEVGQ